MAGVPDDGVRFVIGGTIATVQTWSTGIWVRTTLAGGSWGLSNQQAVTDAWRSMVESWWGALKGFCAADVEFTQVRSYFYPAGTTEAVSVCESLVSSPVAGTGSTPLPTQTAAVASMRTGVAGRSARGRSYFPVNGQGLGADHQLSGANCGSIAGAYQDLLNGINAYDGTAHSLTANICSVASFTKGITRDITQVIVDSKLDTQRRREDKLAPSSTRIVAITI